MFYGIIRLETSLAARVRFLVTVLGFFVARLGLLFAASLGPSFKTR